MVTFITSLILYGFIAAIIGFVGKLIYDVQQNKNKTDDGGSYIENEFEVKEQFQKLAGITPVNPNDEIRNMLVKNNIISPDQLVNELKKEFENSEFPAPDQSIPVVTAKLTTIGGSYEDKDPLASVPMSRVSKEAKQKMAEIAKEDINKQIEEKSINIHPTHLAEIEKELDVMNKIVMGDQRLGMEFKKPKRKYTKKAKQ